MSQPNLREDFSKSELFELSAEFTNDSSQLDDGSFALSNLECDVSVKKSMAN